MESQLIHGRALSKEGFAGIMEEWYVPPRAPYFVIEPGNGINGQVKIRWPYMEDRDEVEAFVQSLQAQWKGWDRGSGRCCA